MVNQELHERVKLPSLKGGGPIEARICNMNGLVDQLGYHCRKAVAPLKPQAKNTILRPNINVTIAEGRCVNRQELCASKSGDLL